MARDLQCAAYRVKGEVTMEEFYKPETGNRKYGTPTWAHMNFRFRQNCMVRLYNSYSFENINTGLKISLKSIGEIIAPDTLIEE